MKRIDLNCDLGELPERIADGTDERVLQFISSVNVACGGHAGNEATMEATVRGAVRYGVGVGAHPSYPDRAGFGRMRMDLSPSAIEVFVERQVRALDEIAKRCGTVVAHVKPHGALYHAAAADPEVARAIARGAMRVHERIFMVGQAGSAALAVWRSMGLKAIGEAFCDRTYEPDGTLRSRSLDGAVIEDPDQAAAQALRIAVDGVVTAADGSTIAVDAETLCIHGDTPGVGRIAAAVRRRLEAAGVAFVRPFAASPG